VVKGNRLGTIYQHDRHTQTHRQPRRNSNIAALNALRSGGENEHRTIFITLVTQTINQSIRVSL